MQNPIINKFFCFPVNFSEHRRIGVNYELEIKILWPIFKYFEALLQHWPSLWSSGESFWLQIQRSEFNYRRYQILWQVVGLERGPLSHVSTTEELLERKSSDSGLENGRRDPSRWPRGILYPQKLPLTSPRSGRRSVGIVRSRTQAKEFFYYYSTAWKQIT
jgi:hypothetical protein